MDGVTVVQEHFCREVELNGLITDGVLITLLFIMFVGGLILLYKSNKEDKPLKLLSVIFSIMLSLFYIVFWSMQINNYNTTHMEYTVVIDESVTFNDFYEKYEILSVNSNEYRVIEK